MIGYIDEDGNSIPMPSIDFGRNTKAAEQFEREWIAEQKRMGREIIY